MVGANVLAAGGQPPLDHRPRRAGFRALPAPAGPARSLSWCSRPSHTVTRLVLDVEASFDDFRDRYEQAVPAVNLAELLSGSGTWGALVERTAELARHGFLIYGRIDVSPLMGLAGHRFRGIEYLMGNHVIAETMFRHEPGIMLYAPLRTLLYEDLEGRTRFSIDQPSTRFASFGHDEIAATGRDLDQKLAALLVVLDLAVPEALELPT